MIFDGLEPGTLYNIYLVGIDEIILPLQKKIIKI